MRHEEEREKYVEMVKGLEGRIMEQLEGVSRQYESVREEMGRRSQEEEERRKQEKRREEEKADEEKKANDERRMKEEAVSNKSKAKIEIKQNQVS